MYWHSNKCQHHTDDQVYFKVCLTSHPVPVTFITIQQQTVQYMCCKDSVGWSMSNANYCFKVEKN